jgi:hypothetical protein
MPLHRYRPWVAPILCLQRVGRGTQRLCRSKPGVEPVSSRSWPGGQLPSSTRTTRPVAKLPGGGALVCTSSCMHAETRKQETRSITQRFFMFPSVARGDSCVNILRRREGLSHSAPGCGAPRVADRGNGPAGARSGTGPHARPACRRGLDPADPPSRADLTSPRNLPRPQAGERPSRIRRRRN